jgi:hypothetical protein
MCCTCDPNLLIEAHRKGTPVTFLWKETPDVALEAEAEGKEAEFSPARIRLRKPGQEWSRWFYTKDLAATMLRIGTDVKWKYVPAPVQDWLTGSGDFPFEALKSDKYLRDEP